MPKLPLIKDGLYPTVTNIPLTGSQLQPSDHIWEEDTRGCGFIKLPQLEITGHKLVI